ncbi:threonine ammonia-lyase [Nannocystaceae bacterium ST9]
MTDEYLPEHAELWAERLGPADVAAAGERLVGRVIRTPVLRVPRLDALAGVPIELWLKAENMQRIGAFKARGALHAVGRLDPALRERGVITFSSGNHAQAVALAAKEFGVKATIAMPIDAPAVKLAVVRELGAEVILAGTTSEQRKQAALAVQAQTGAAIIQPFDHPDIVCGQGTATSELLDEVWRGQTELDALFVPVGGGGVIAGACLACRGLVRPPAIYAVEPVGCDALAKSLAAGERVAVEPGPTIADGLKPVSVGALNFAIAKRDLAGAVQVDDDELGRALVDVLLRAKILVEPSGVAGVAAALREAPRLSAEREGRVVRIGVLLTGGNVEPSLVAELLGRWGSAA